MSDTKKEAKEVLRGILMAILLYFVIQISLTVATGVDNPISVVISGSMDHHGMAFDEWWDEKSDEYLPFDISETEFAAFPYTDGFERGDILFVTGVNTDDVVVGDVIVFSRDSDQIPVVHRVVDIFEYDGARYFLTKGDFNTIADNYHSGSILGIEESRVIGKVSHIVPNVGNITLWFRGLLGNEA